MTECPNCGARPSPDAKRCVKCGTKFPDPPPVVTTPAAPVARRTGDQGVRVAEVPAARLVPPAGVVPVAQHAIPVADDGFISEQLPRKSPFLAALLNFLFPLICIGQLYNGTVLRWLFFLGCAGVGILLGATEQIEIEPMLSWMIIVHVSSIIDAWWAASKINRKRGY